MSQVTITNEYITKMYDRLDKICSNRYGSDDNDIVLYVIEQNPGLEQYDFLLPMGLLIKLPDAPVNITTPVLQQVYLWT